MTLYFEMAPAQGAPARLVLQPGLQRIESAIGDRYRIYDDRTGKAPPDIVVKRLDNHMIIEGLPDGAAVELTDFYARCGISSPCTFVVDMDAVSSAAPVVITPASPPLQALTDGSFVVYPADYKGGPTTAVADGDSFPRAAAYAVGGLAIVGLAAAGGGGGGGGGGEGGASPPPAAAVPGPDAQVPAPAPAPPPSPPDDGEVTAPNPPPATTVLVLAVADSAAPRTGNVANGGATNDNTPTVSGSLSAPLAPGEAVQVLRNGSAIAAGVVVEGVAWRVTDAAVGDGSYTYTARVVDAEGAGPASAGYRIIVDTVNDKTAAIASVTDNVAPGVGIVRDGGTTNDSTPGLNGTLSQAPEAGEELQVLRDDIVIGAGAVSGRNWNFTDSGLVNRDYDYNVRIVDAAGNLGRESATFDLRVRFTGGGPGASRADAPVTDPLAVDQVEVEPLRFDALLAAAQPAEIAPPAPSSAWMASSIDSLVNAQEIF